MLYLCKYILLLCTVIFSISAKDNTSEVDKDTAKVKGIEESDLKTLLESGDVIGNGGNGTIAEFKHIVLSALEDIETISLSSQDKKRYDLPKMKKIVLSSLIVCRENLIFKGKEVDAINFSEHEPQVIFLNCNKIKSFSHYQKLGLALHEYSFLYGLDDETYFYSQELLKLYEKGKRKDALSTYENYLSALMCDLDKFYQTVRATDPYLMILGAEEMTKNTFQGAVVKKCTPIIKEILSMRWAYIDKSYEYSFSAYFLLSLLDYMHDYESAKSLEMVKLLAKATRFGLSGYKQKTTPVNTCHFNELYTPPRLKMYLRAGVCGDVYLRLLSIKLDKKKALSKDTILELLSEGEKQIFGL